MIFISKAYFPKVVYDETDDVTNETLADVIKTASVNDAIHVYELMLKNETGKLSAFLFTTVIEVDELDIGRLDYQFSSLVLEVSESNKQSLLELICFFNETEQLAEELIEERWFSQYGQEKVTVRNTWK